MKELVTTVGFMVVDELANKIKTEINQNKFKGLYTKFKYHGEDVILLKPANIYESFW